MKKKGKPQFRAGRPFADRVRKLHQSGRLETLLPPKGLAYTTAYYCDRVTMEEIAAQYGVNISTVSRALRDSEYKIWREEYYAPPVGPAAVNERRNDPCLGCWYSYQAGDLVFCIYILWTFQRRPCPAGAECRVRRVSLNPWGPPDPAQHLLPSMTPFARRLSEAVRQSGKPPVEIARRAGIGRTTLYDYRLGLRRPSDEIIFRLEDALGLAPGELME